jgi:hypothetical protein
MRSGAGKAFFVDPAPYFGIEFAGKLDPSLVMDHFLTSLVPARGFFKRLL